MNNQYKDKLISTTIIEMNRMNQNQTRLIMKTTKDKDGNIIKTTYPPQYQQNKLNHRHNFDDVLKRIFCKALEQKWTGMERKIATYMYDNHHREYNFNIEDLDITMECDDPTSYICFINNDKWNVSYYFRHLDWEQQKTAVLEHTTENLCYFTPHSIFIHLEGQTLGTYEKDESDFVDTDTKCPLCLEDYCEEREADKLHNCGHKYCVDCIENAIDYGTCSICRMTTDIENEPEPITMEMIEELCGNEETELLVNLLKDNGVFELFIKYCIQGDGVSHILGYDGGEEDNEGNILLCRMDSYEKKTPNPAYNF
jgi:hypothetical protein